METYISVIDNFGRLIIPESISHRLNAGREFEIKMHQSQIMVNLNCTKRCLICGNNQNLIGRNGLSVCESCLKTALSDEFLDLKDNHEEPKWVEFLDEEGRLYIPEHFRRKLLIGFNTSVILEFDDNDLNLLKRPEVAGCFICGSKNKVYNFEKINLCSACYKELSKKYPEDI